MFLYVCSLSTEQADRVQRLCLLSLRVTSAGWILTAGILDSLIQGLKDTDREGPGKAPVGLGFLGSGTVLASRKVTILYFILFFLIAFLFKSGARAQVLGC